MLIQYIETPVPAGFPSPADDYLEKPLDLNEHLVHHPSSTYYIRVQDESMVCYGIFNGDLLIVDRSLNPRRGDIVMVTLDGELTCKYFTTQNGMPCLKSGKYPSILVTDNDACVWGIVIHRVHTYRNRVI